jgi:hypothetical protein
MRFVCGVQKRRGGGPCGAEFASLEGLAGHINDRKAHRLASKIKVFKGSKKPKEKTT